MPIGNAKKICCQVCKAGFGKFKPDQRYQTLAMFACKKCSKNVCGPACWAVLHGYYDDKLFSYPEAQKKVVYNQGKTHAAGPSKNESEEEDDAEADADDEAQAHDGDAECEHCEEGEAEDAEHIDITG
jgi:hypothetical protein